MKPKTVVVWWREFGRCPEITYAAKLALCLQARLKVCVDISQEHVDSMTRLSQCREDPRPRIEQSIHKCFEGQRVDVRFNPHIDPFDVSSLAVSNDSSIWRPIQNTVWIPGGASQIHHAHSEGILVPIGNGESGVFAARHVMPIAQMLGMPVTFWHTTWKESAVTSTNPYDHMTDAARSALAACAGMAQQHGVASQVVVETADDVVEGITRFALRNRMMTIAMARGQKTGRGKYGERLAARPSPVPLLLFGRSL
jgi:nucleotide-binding universal stress UspA family protein